MLLLLPYFIVRKESHHTFKKEIRLCPANYSFYHFVHREFTHQDNNSIIKSENVILEINQLMHDWEVLNSVLGVPIAKKPVWIGK